MSRLPSAERADSKPTPQRRQAENNGRERKNAARKWKPGDGEGLSRENSCNWLQEGGANLDLHQTLEKHGRLHEGFRDGGNDGNNLVFGFGAKSMPCRARMVAPNGVAVQGEACTVMNRFTFWQKSFRLRRVPATLTPALLLSCLGNYCFNSYTPVIIMVLCYKSI